MNTNLLQGCFTTKEGLKIAYLSGVQPEDILSAKSHNYTPENLQNLEVKQPCLIKYKKYL